MAATSPVDEHLVDLRLHVQTQALAFADVYAHGTAAKDVEQFAVGQRIVNHHAGGVQAAGAFHGNQANIAGARANEKDLAGGLRFRSVGRQTRLPESCKRRRQRAQWMFGFAAGMRLCLFAQVAGLFAQTR